MYYRSTITKIWKWAFKIYDRGNTADQRRVVNAVVSIEISVLKKKLTSIYQINKTQFQLDCRSKCIR